MAVTQTLEVVQGLVNYMKVVVGMSELMQFVGFLIFLSVDGKVSTEGICHALSKFGLWESDLDSNKFVVPIALQDATENINKLQRLQFLQALTDYLAK